MWRTYLLTFLIKAFSVGSVGCLAKCLLSLRAKRQIVLYKTDLQDSGGSTRTRVTHEQWPCLPASMSYRSMDPGVAKRVGNWFTRLI